MSELETELRGGGGQAHDGVTARSGRFDIVRICVAGLIGALLLIILALDLLGDSDHPRPRSAEPRENVVTLTEEELLSRARSIETPAFWIGRRPGIDQFELEESADGDLYVRYLTGNVPTDRRKSDSLTVGSYPVAEAGQRLEQAARGEGDVLTRHDGFMVLRSHGSQSAYVVFDDLPDLQVEIYAPRRGEAARLAASGALTPLH